MEGQLRREIEILTHARHKNVIGFYGYFWDTENIYMILEYAPGGQLFDELKA
jgi:serine/threonine protein kinase